MDNQYGLDNQYFEKWIDRIRKGGFSNWRPDELARELARMSKAADKFVLTEPEFNPEIDIKNRIDALCVLCDIEPAKNWRESLGLIHSKFNSMRNSK